MLNESLRLVSGSSPGFFTCGWPSNDLEEPVVADLPEFVTRKQGEGYLAVVEVVALDFHYNPASHSESL